MVIGMKYLFRGHIIKKWSRTDFSFLMKYIELNKVVIACCMNFYLKYWEDRNEYLHNLEEQWLRIVDWYENEQKEALKGDYPQVKKYIQSNKLKVENTTIEYMRRWIFILKEIKNKVETYANREDIRGYFIT